MHVEQVPQGMHDEQPHGQVHGSQFEEVWALATLGATMLWTTGRASAADPTTPTRRMNRRRLSLAVSGSRGA